MTYTWYIEQLKKMRHIKERREALEQASREYLSDPRFGYRYYAEKNGVNINTLYSNIRKQNGQKR